jgi:hypothetical protein
MLGRNNKVICLRDEHLNKVEAVAEIMLARVQRLLFYYLVHILLVRCHPLRTTCVAFDFLVELACGGTSLLFLNYEIWSFNVVNQGVLANIG